MSSHVKVYQISSKEAYLNLDDEFGYVSAGGCCYSRPTYLLQNGIFFTLIHFDDQKFADEWMEENASRYFKITKIEETERV